MANSKTKKSGGGEGRASGQEINILRLAAAVTSIGRNSKMGHVYGLKQLQSLVAKEAGYVIDPDYLDVWRANQAALIEIAECAGIVVELPAPPQPETKPQVESAAHPAVLATQLCKLREDQDTLYSNLLLELKQLREEIRTERDMMRQLWSGVDGKLDLALTSGFPAHTPVVTAK